MPLRPATEADLATVIELIHALAEYEREPDAVRLDPEELSRHLFGPRPYAEVLLAETESGENTGFALFFRANGVTPAVTRNKIAARVAHNGHIKTAQRVQYIFT